MLKKLLYFFIISNSLYADVITITGDEWCPYNCKKSDINQGFMVDIARSIFQKHGDTLIYHVASSWENAVEETRQNKYNAIIGTIPDEAKDFIFPSEPQSVSTDSFFVSKESKWKYEGVKSLTEVTIGVIKGYSYTPKIDAYIQKNKYSPKHVQVISGNRAVYQNAKKLLYKTIDVLIEDPYVLNYYFSLEKSKIPFKIVGNTGVSNIYIAFSPNNINSQKYSEILSEGMIKLRESGELEQILSKYGLQNGK